MQNSSTLVQTKSLLILCMLIMGVKNTFYILYKYFLHDRSHIQIGPYNRKTRWVTCPGLAYHNGDKINIAF